MKRLVYLYPEEWTGRRSRETHCLETCLALADEGVDITLVTGAGVNEERELAAVGRRKAPEGFQWSHLSQQILLIRSWRLFSWNLQNWIDKNGPFDLAYLVHLKAAPVIKQIGLPYWWEAREVFAETPKAGSVEAMQIDAMEGEALANADGRTATNTALAQALSERYRLPNDFHIVPHGVPEPLDSSLSEVGGPLVYAGTLGNWKGLDLAIRAAAAVDLPVRVIGGTKSEWETFLKQNDFSEEELGHVRWRERVKNDLIPERLSGCRVGLSPTRPQEAAGRYAMPMKLFEYARCGIPVLCSELPALADLADETWCRQVAGDDLDDWIDAMRNLPRGGGLAMAWATTQTYRRRAKAIKGFLEL